MTMKSSSRMLASKVCLVRQRHSVPVRTATSTSASESTAHLPPPKDQSVRFGFSAGGLLFPFYIGVCRGLEQAGYLSPNTKLAGASAGSLIAACVNSGLSMDTVSALCEDLMEDCRKNGTRGRLGIVLEKFLQAALPEDAHIRCGGKTFVAVSSIESSSGKFGTPTGQLVSDFSDRDDLIDALMTYVMYSFDSTFHDTFLTLPVSRRSCHIPIWLDGRLTNTFRGTLHLDGGVTNFIPLPPDDGTPGVRISCFGAKQMGLVYDIGIAPDVFDEWPHSLPTMVQWAFSPADEHFQRMLVDRGEADALSWASRFETQQEISREQLEGVQHQA